MAKFTVKDPDSGQTVTLTSEDSTPPTEQELEEVFSGLGQQGSETSDSERVPLGNTGLLTDSNAGLVEPELNSPLNPIERGMLSIPSSFEAKRSLMSTAFGLNPNDIQQMDNGKLSIKGVPVDPTPRGIISFLKDLPGDIGDAIGPGLPIAGQIGADIAAVGSGVGTAGIIGANAAGAAGGETVRQGLSSLMTGEQMNPMEIGAQGAIAGAGAAGAMALNAGASGLIRQTSKFGNFLAKKMPDKLPAILESVGQIDREATKTYVDLLQKGARSSDIINDVTANPLFAAQYSRRTLLGHALAEETPESLISNFQNMARRVKSPEDLASIKGAFKEYFQLSDDTLDLLEKRIPAKELMSQANTSDEALANLGKLTINGIKKAEEDLQEEFGGVIRNIMASPEGKRIKIDADGPINDMLKKLASVDENPNGIGLMSGGKINPNYTGEEEKKLYSEVFKRFMGLEKKGIPGSISPKDFSKYFDESGNLLSEFKTGELVLKNQPISLIDAHRLLSELKPKLDKAFRSPVFSDQVMKPLSEFLDALRTKIASASPELGKMKQKYGMFQELKKGLFGKLNARNLEDRITAIKSLRDIALNKDPAIRSQFIEASKQLDSFLPHKIYPKLRQVIAAEELKAVDVAGGIQKFMRDSVSLLPKDSNEIKSIFLNRFNEAIPQKNLKFVNDAKSHLVAREFTDKPQNFFRMRALAYLLGAHTVGTTVAGPAGGALSILGMMAGTNPRNLGKFAEGVVSASEKQFSPKAVGAAGQFSQRQILSSLLRLSGNKSVNNDN
jgi:hypothetical protein